MSSNSPYESTVILQNDALNKMLANIKNYPVAGKKTGIRLRPNKDGTRLQIQNVRTVNIVPDGNKTYLVIEDPTDDDILNNRYTITGELNFSPETSLTQDADLTPGMFNVKENNILKQSVLITGFDRSQNLVLGNGNTTKDDDNGVLVATKVRGAVFNDYAEYRESLVKEPGRCVIETGYGDLELSTKRLQLGGNIISDTFGFSIGETNKAETPIAVCGRVLAYPYEDRYKFTAGAAVCSGPNGTVSLMTREEIREWPDAIIGYVSEIPEYKEWGTDKIQVNNRIWIKKKKKKADNIMLLSAFFILI